MAGYEQEVTYIVNPLHACAVRVMVVAMSVCVCVCLLSVCLSVCQSVKSHLTSGVSVVKTLPHTQQARNLWCFF